MEVDDFKYCQVEIFTIKLWSLASAGRHTEGASEAQAVAFMIPFMSDFLIFLLSMSLCEKVIKFGRIGIKPL